jgi:molybdopterin-guanine dinucleotide biosynthesis protein MobB
LQHDGRCARPDLPKKRTPPIVAVCGVKNSGKTTLLAGILPLLKQKGLRVAAIKHDAHDFDPDVPGTDSYRLRHAGADKVAIFSKTKTMVIAQCPNISFEILAEAFGDVDLILLEGGKATDYPKIEVVRSGVGSRPVSNPSLAICTDLDIPNSDVPCYRLEQYQQIADLIAEHLKSNSP